MQQRVERVRFATLIVIALGLAGCSGQATKNRPPSVTGEAPPTRRTAASVTAGLPQVTILSPLDAGTVTSSPETDQPHHTPMGGDWASDLAGGGAAYARFANPSGPLVLTMEEELDPCGVPNSGGLAAVISVSVGGTRLGTVAYLHLESVEVSLGEVPNGAKLGDMVAAPPATSRCWGYMHTHLEPKNASGHSCWVSRPLNSSVDYSTPLGVLGGGWADGPNQTCPTGVEHGTDAEQATAASHDPVGRLESAARVDGGIRLVGWARDGDAPDDAIAVQGLIDGAVAGASSTRPIPGGLAAPLFDFVIPADSQRHEVCARGLNVGDGTDETLGNCITVP